MPNRAANYGLMLISAAIIADVEHENDTEDTSAEVPDHLITVNQVVAWNIAWYRRRAGLTQKDLGDRIGWANTAVSEAERSWDGKRTREFDAQVLAEIAVALGVPLLALFLPPADDGARERYTFPAATGDDCLEGDMRDLLALAMPDSDDQTPVMDAYRARLRATVARYRDPSWEEDVATWLSGANEDAIRAEHAAFLRSERDGLVRAAELLDRVAGAIEKAEAQ